MKPNHDPEKLLDQFRKSKKTVQAWTDQFLQSNGRKPHGKDLESAPEYVRVCIKNCKKIKTYLANAEKSNKSPPKEPIKPKENSPSNIPPNAKTSPSTEPQAKSSKSKVWGSHLNRANSDGSGTSSKGFNALSRSSSFNGTLSSLIIEDIAKNTRKSLTKKRSTPAKTSFFDTMGEESTLQGLMDATETTFQEPPQKLDPLVLFHPELSMDGLSQHGMDKPDQEGEIINDEECEIESFASQSIIKTKLAKQHVNDGKSMSVLNSVKCNKNAEAKERTFNEEAPTLSFAGLFSSKSNVDDNDNEDDVNASKRKSDSDVSDLDCPNSKRQRLDENDDYEFDDENHDSANIPESELLPYDPSHDVADEEDKTGDRRKARKPTKLEKKLVSTNFVKIDMKKKNYVRGKSNMTGAKYKRMEWKRKVNGKFGRSK